MSPNPTVAAAAKRNVETITQLEQELVAQQSRTERWETLARDQEVSELSQNTEIAALVDEIEKARVHDAVH